MGNYYQIKVFLAKWEECGILSLEKNRRGEMSVV